MTDEVDFLANPYAEIDAAIARDQAKHPPGLNVFGKPLKPQSTEWRQPFQVPGSKASGRASEAERKESAVRERNWQPPPELIQAMKTRYATDGPGALAKEFNIPVSRIYVLRQKLGVSAGGPGKGRKPRPLNPKRKRGIEPAPSSPDAVPSTDLVARSPIDIPVGAIPAAKFSGVHLRITLGGLSIEITQ